MNSGKLLKPHRWLNIWVGHAPSARSESRFPTTLKMASYERLLYSRRSENASGEITQATGPYERVRLPSLL
jgi:hypothetical protein